MVVSDADDGDMNAGGMDDAADAAGPCLLHKGAYQSATVGPDMYTTNIKQVQPARPVQLCAPRVM